MLRRVTGYSLSQQLALISWRAISADSIYLCFLFYFLKKKNMHLYTVKKRPVITVNSLIMLLQRMMANYLEY